MNDISKGRSPSAAARIARGIGAAVLSTVLIAGLAGCMTGKLAGSGPVLERNAVAPAGVDRQQPADRIAEQLARQTGLQGMTADHYERLVARAQ